MKKSLKDVLKNKKNPTRKEPLWKGPEVDGITQSMLSRFLVCRERFRVKVIEGLAPQEGFNARMEYGNMWHVCEEAALEEKQHFDGDLSGIDTTNWTDRLEEYVLKLRRQYPLQQEEINKWWMCCRVQFPIYWRYWRDKPSTDKYQPVVQEEVFRIPYMLPSGRTVFLRGKWDSVDLVPSGPNQGIWLQENKTKSEIDSIGLQRQLTFDLQSMFYMTALNVWLGQNKTKVIGAGTPYWYKEAKGVRYNVVRRPLSGGKGTIRRHQPTKTKPQGETEAEYYERLRSILVECPDEYYARWNVEVPALEVAKFQKDFLNPVLEALCNWYSIITNEPITQKLQDCLVGYGHHWRHPFGVYNPMDEGGHSDLDNYLATGNTVGLTKVKSLFRELETEADAEQG